MESLPNLDLELADGRVCQLYDWLGQVLLIVNTASQCGFTPQYSGLQTLHNRYGAQGFQVLAFPCNQFGQQEPDDAASIQLFCQREFHVDFPLFAKTDVNGEQAHPLFEALKAAQGGILGTTTIKWNFTKFLVDRELCVVRRYGSITKPETIAPDIEALL